MSSSETEVSENAKPTLQMDRLLDVVVKQDASDLHLSCGRPPTIRLSGRLRNLATKTLEPEDMMQLMKSVTPEKNQQELQEMGGTDFGFAFGTAELLDGLEVTIVAVGLFAVGEAMFMAWKGHAAEGKVEKITGSLWLDREGWRRSWKPWLRGTFFGFPIGAMPAGGAELCHFRLDRARVEAVLAEARATTN